MNELTLVVVHDDPERTGEYRPVDILIDGDRLIDMLKRIETPLASAEGSPQIAGDYGSRSVKTTLFPSRHFLGAPQTPLIRGAKVAILLCSCGCEGCWDFACRMTFSENLVTWSDFEQVHRNWDYAALGPFVFDRKKYEAEFAKSTNTRK